MRSQGGRDAARGGLRRQGGVDRCRTRPPLRTAAALEDLPSARVDFRRRRRARSRLLRGARDRAQDVDHRDPARPDDLGGRARLRRAHPLRPAPPRDRRRTASPLCSGVGSRRDPLSTDREGFRCHPRRGDRLGAGGRHRRGVDRCRGGCLGTPARCRGDDDRRRVGAAGTGHGPRGGRPSTAICTPHTGSNSDSGSASSRSVAPRRSKKSA